MSSCSGSWNNSGSKWSRQGLDQDSPKSKVGYCSFTPRFSKLPVYNVGVDHAHLEYPEKDFPPPFHAFVQEAVIRGELIQLVHTKHVLIVVSNNSWLLFGVTRPESKQLCII